MFLEFLLFPFHCFFLIGPEHQSFLKLTISLRKWETALSIKAAAGMCIFLRSGLRWQITVFSAATWWAEPGNTGSSKRASSSGGDKMLIWHQNIWQFVPWCNPRTSLSHKCTFFRNVSPFKRKLSNWSRFICEQYNKWSPSAFLIWKKTCIFLHTVLKFLLKSRILTFSHFLSFTFFILIFTFSTLTN